MEIDITPSLTLPHEGEGRVGGGFRVLMLGEMDSAK